MKLYVLESDGFYKIGITDDDLKRRVKALQTGNPHKINVVASYELPKNKCISFEGCLHDIFKETKQHVLGEWFSFTKGGIDAVKDICESYVNTLVADGK